MRKMSNKSVSKPIKGQPISKFDWKARQSGGPKEKIQNLGFDGNIQKKGLPKTEKFVEMHKEFRKDIRKPR